MTAGQPPDPEGLRSDSPAAIISTPSGARRRRRRTPWKRPQCTLVSRQENLGTPMSGGLPAQQTPPGEGPKGRQPQPTGLGPRASDGAPPQWEAWWPPGKGPLPRPRCRAKPGTWGHGRGREDRLRRQPPCMPGPGGRGLCCLRQAKTTTHSRLTRPCLGGLGRVCGRGGRSSGRSPRTTARAGAWKPERTPDSQAGGMGRAGPPQGPRRLGRTGPGSVHASPGRAPTPAGRRWAGRAPGPFGGARSPPVWPAALCTCVRRPQPVC